MHTPLLCLFYVVSMTTAIMVGATTHMQAADPTMHMLALSGRLVLLLGNTLLLYILTANSSYLRAKRYGSYLAQFAPFYISVLVSLVLDSIHGMATIIATTRGTEIDHIHSQPWYWISAIAMQLSYCAQVTCSAITTGRVGDEDMV
eukprot:jgi/Ulvmu1/8046/UM004_0283.1